MFFKKTGFTGREKSIAVLPFDNMSSDKENEYFSDGMTEEITTQLTKIAELKVIGSTSAKLYKGSKKTIREIAEELGVASILEGNVQKTGNQIKITAKLIDVNSLQNIWAITWDREFKEVFAIQSEVAQEIAFKLNATLTKEEKKNIEKKPTNNSEAYEYYLQGREMHDKFFQTHNLEFYVNSKTMFSKAITLDSNFALAHAALADLYNTYTSGIKKDSILVDLQIKEIEKAWLIDSTLDYVYQTRGSVQIELGNYENAYDNFRRALELNPNEANNLWTLAELLNRFGLYDESIKLLDKAIKINPLDASNFAFRGAYYYLLYKPDDALKDLKIAVQLEPENFTANYVLIYLYSIQDSLNKVKKLLIKSTIIPAYAYAKIGDKKKALEFSPDWRTYLALGMKEEAVKAMIGQEAQKDNPRRNDFLLFKSHLSHKDFNSIRNDPRFLDLMEKKRIQYEENKKKFSVADIIAKFPSSTP